MEYMAGGWKCSSVAPKAMAYHALRIGGEVCQALEHALGQGTIVARRKSELNGHRREAADVARVHPDQLVLVEAEVGEAGLDLL